MVTRIMDKILIYRTNFQVLVIFNTENYVLLLIPEYLNIIFYGGI